MNLGQSISLIDVVTVSVSILSFGVSLAAFLFSRARFRTQRKDQGEQTRLILLRDLFSGFSEHNWRFIEYWGFPGVHPGLEELMEETPNNTDDRYRKDWAVRVVTLEHLNVLMKVYTHQQYLTKEDLIGFINWAHSWYKYSQKALKLILKTGDLYPLDFILWLRDTVFKRKTNFPELIGRTLEARLSEYENKNR